MAGAPSAARRIIAHPVGMLPGMCHLLCSQDEIICRRGTGGTGAGSPGTRWVPGGRGRSAPEEGERCRHGQQVGAGGAAPRKKLNAVGTGAPGGGAGRAASRENASRGTGARSPRKPPKQLMVY